MQPKDVEFVFESYALLEDKLRILMKTVPLSKENEGTWSPELASMLVEAGNLLDSISRAILGGGGALNITDFERILFMPMHLLNANIVIYTYPLQTMKPFDSYRGTDGWWTLYNRLKHNRTDHYESANLVNVLKATGSLFLLLTRYVDSEFTMALQRREWLITGYVPEYAHVFRMQEGNFWYDTPLFGGAELNGNLPNDPLAINPVMASRKFQRFIGRFN